MLRLALAVAALVLFAAACKDSSDVQTLAITIDDGGCAPTSFEVDPGRSVKLAIENESDAAYIIQDGDGRLEEIAVEAGESTEAFFQVPEGDGTYTLACEGESGETSEVTLVAGTGIADEPTSDATAPSGIAEGTLAVTLLDFEVSASAATLRPGPVTMIATNVSRGSAHELNILQLQPDGELVRVAGIEPIAAQQGGSVSTTLEPGTYRLACQIMPGELGSTVDHYQQGMWLNIVVEPQD